METAAHPRFLFNRRSVGIISGDSTSFSSAGAGVVKTFRCVSQTNLFGDVNGLGNWCGAHATGSSCAVRILCDSVSLPFRVHIRWDADNRNLRPAACLLPWCAYGRWPADHFTTNSDLRILCYWWAFARDRRLSCWLHSSTQVTHNMVFTQGRGCRHWRVFRLVNFNRFGQVPSTASPRTPTIFGNVRTVGTMFGD